MNVYGYCIITASEPYALRTSKTLFFPFSFLTLPFGLAHHRYFIHSACIRSDIIDSWENFGSRTSYSQFQWLVTHSVSVSHMHTRFQFILIFTSIIGHGKTPPTYSMLVTCVLQQHQRWWWRRRPTTAATKATTIDAILRDKSNQKFHLFGHKFRVWTEDVWLKEKQNRHKFENN